MGKEESKWLRESKRKGGEVLPPPPLSLSLSTGSTSIFRLLWVCPEGPLGEQGIKVGDPKEPWASEEIAIKDPLWGTNKGLRFRSLYRS